jgi:hypothetical protein
MPVGVSLHDRRPRQTGHLALLREAAADLGGSLTVDGGPGCTAATVGLPPA